MESILAPNLEEQFRRDIIRRLPRRMVTPSVKEPKPPSLPKTEYDLQLVYENLDAVLRCRYIAPVFIWGVAQALVKQKHALKVTDALQKRIFLELVKIVENRKEMEQFVRCVSEVIVWTMAGVEVVGLQVEEPVPSIWTTAQLIDEHYTRPAYIFIFAVSYTLAQRTQAQKIRHYRTLLLGATMLTLFFQTFLNITLELVG